MILEDEDFEAADTVKTKMIEKKFRCKKMFVPKMRGVHRLNDNLLDMLKARLAGKKCKSA